MRIDIHTSRLSLTPELRERIQRRASFALSRLGSRVARVEVHLADINGPRGGVDKRCRLLIYLDRGAAVTVERLDGDLMVLIDRCFATATRAVHKRVATETAQRFLPRQAFATAAPLPSAEIGP